MEPSSVAVDGKGIELAKLSGIHIGLVQYELAQIGAGAIVIVVGGQDIDLGPNDG